jgi:iron complex outermembrane recepter protein
MSERVGPAAYRKQDFRGEGMSQPFVRSFRRAAISGVALAAMAPALASAQEAPAEDEPFTDDIVVTGSLIRGAAPVGSNLIAVGQDQIAQTGATSSNELLASIPQVTNYFNRVPAADLAIAANQIQISRPNLRNISPTTAASSATLILFDGHRIATAGTKQASVDPDLIPTGAIERVEVVTEGGSATYGADAVAGVINFITRKKFDGLKVEGRYGFADKYWQVDANATLGKDWGSGSAYVSYTFTKSDALYGRDRRYIRRLDYSSQPYRGLEVQCAQPNITVGGQTFAAQNLTTPGQNRCDSTDNSSLVPEAERHGALASLYQELSDSTSIQVKAFYSQRETVSHSDLGGQVNVTTANPFYRQVPSRPGAAQTVAFNFVPAVGRSDADARILIQEWGANAELSQKLGDNWQFRGLFNYSRSNSQYNQQVVATDRLSAAGTATTAATAVNPYDIAATNPAVIANILDNENAGQARDELLDLRGIIDGRLLSLPGGDVRLAIGYEYMYDSLQLREKANIRRGALASSPYSTYSRRVHSVFGELNIPVFGTENATFGLDSLVLSGSARYDSYSDFGDTFNPKLGATWKPVSWLAIRGNWGTSFTAPTPLDQLGSRNNMLGFFPFAPFIRPADRAAGVTFFSGGTLAYQGSRPDLQPQKADTWSVGFDLDAPFAEGLHASLSYYNVKFKDILSIPTPGDGIFVNFPNNITTALPSAGGIPRAAIEALRGTALGADAAVNQALASPTPIYSIIDFRTGNYGILKVTGLDFSLTYRRDTGFGGVDFSVNGNYQLSRKSQVTANAPVVDLLNGNFTTGVDAAPQLSLQASAGANIGALRAQATWNHTSGYGIPATTGVPPQTSVGAFDTVNLFFKYDVPGDSMLMKDLSITLNVNNVFDQDPPELRRNGQNENGFANGFTLGRLVIIGLSKQF